MILDKGIATVYRKRNTAAPGAKPTFTDEQFFQSWYGELGFETSSFFQTEKREEVKTDARVRVLQNREIKEHDRVTLEPLNGAPRAYEVTRAAHYADRESGEMITDLNLEEVSP